MIFITQLAQQMDHAIASNNTQTIEACIKYFLAHKETLKESQKSPYHYFLANAYSALRHIKYTSREKAWNWNKNEYNKSILYLRKAIEFLKFCTEQTDLAQRIYTNYANELNHYGRFVEAAEQCREALNIRPFGMAFYGYAESLRTYVGFLYISQHQEVFLSKIEELTNHALTFNLENGANESCQNLQDWLSHYPIKPINIQYYSSFELGKSKKEREYRQWCLENRLFLNPLNDLFGEFASLTNTHCQYSTIQTC